MKQKSIPRSGEKEVIISLISFLKEKKQQRQSADICVYWEWSFSKDEDPRVRDLVRVMPKTRWGCVSEIWCSLCSSPGQQLTFPRTASWTTTYSKKKTGKGRISDNKPEAVGMSSSIDKWESLGEISKAIKTPGDWFVWRSVLWCLAWLINDSFLPFFDVD